MIYITKRNDFHLALACILAVLSHLWLWQGLVERFGSTWTEMYSHAVSYFIQNTPDECRNDGSNSSSSYGYSDMPGEFAKCRKQLKKAGRKKKHPLIGKNIEEIIKLYGYPSEAHEVTTEDGYIITLHRIPNKKGASVLLWHGLGASADCWVFNGPTQSLAFVLAARGYDVWLGNSRGSTYSLGHEKHSSLLLPYWDFSWHENGMYDLPASIKHIRKKNGDKPIFYVGHSQGTTNFMVGASTRPASDVLNKDSIKAAFLLAPSAFLGRHGSDSNRAIAPLLVDPTISTIVRTAFLGRISSKKKLEELSKVYLGGACTPEAILCGVCTALYLYLSGFSAALANYTNTPHLLDKHPNNVPIKSAIHYAQSIHSCKFRQYNYGALKNMALYGSEQPPDYELKNINAPTYFYWAEKDGTCQMKDVNRTKNAFNEKVVKGFIRVDFDDFNHSDFVIAKNATELLYNQMISEMQKLTDKQGDIEDSEKSEELDD